jgi:hypothetical protein
MDNSQNEEALTEEKDSPNKLADDITKKCVQIVANVNRFKQPPQICTNMGTLNEIEILSSSIRPVRSAIIATDGSLRNPARTLATAATPRTR